jgi:hypothetical protein
MMLLIILYQFDSDTPYWFVIMCCHANLLRHICYSILVYVLFPGCSCCGTWISSPMVWKPCDNGMVDTSLAQWGFCDMGNKLREQKKLKSQHNCISLIYFFTSGVLLSCRSVLSWMEHLDSIFRGIHNRFQVGCSCRVTSDWGNKKPSIYLNILNIHCEFGGLLENVCHVFG